MARSLDKELQRISDKEDKNLNRAEKKSKKASNLKDLKTGLVEKIPDKLIDTLNEGFCKAFHLIFSKGLAVIEKTYKEDELFLDFKVNDFRINQKPDTKSLKQLEKGIQRGHRINTCTTVVEGIGLGAIGVGLPDIPLFLGLLLKGIYETSIGYGYNYKEEKEQILILKMIAAALSIDELKREANKEVEDWINEMTSEVNCSNLIEEEIQRASKALSEAMLLSKFLQGFFVVGMVGGIANPIIYQKVMKYVSVKYKKRYINEKRKSIKNER